MASLDTFLTATDLDDLLDASHDLDPLSPDGIARIESILANWSDHQAVANLLFHPRVIPSDVRNQAISRGLKSEDPRYHSLAAVVGLQGVDPTDVPESMREEWRREIINMLRSDYEVIAARASVTMFSWFQGDAATRIISLYPVSNKTASSNILALGLSAYGDRPKDEFARRIAACDIGPREAKSFMKLYAKSKKKTAGGELGAAFMTCPLLCYIPNFCEISAAPRRKAWWRFW